MPQSGRMQAKATLKKALSVPPDMLIPLSPKKINVVRRTSSFRHARNPTDEVTNIGDKPRKGFFSGSMQQPQGVVLRHRKKTDANGKPKRPVSLDLSSLTGQWKEDARRSLSSSSDCSAGEKINLGGRGRFKALFWNRLRSPHPFLHRWVNT
ncbi:uncharacterized protein LOC143446770 [Clavelina lepadiformis]|uniref:uncharacterized protein LOC143446770 n=1 Tax=Clavelina lepadiformis TaxID=159417 RepID=UPI004042BF10